MGYNYANIVYNLGKNNFILISLPLCYGMYYFTAGVLKPESTIRKVLRKMFFHSYVFRYLLEGVLDLYLYSMMTIYEG